jgi:hypothetical protein
MVSLSPHLKRIVDAEHPRFSATEMARWRRTIAKLLMRSVPII